MSHGFANTHTVLLMFKQRALQIDALAGEPAIGFFRKGGLQKVVKILSRRTGAGPVFHGDLHGGSQFSHTFQTLSAGFTCKFVYPLRLLGNGRPTAFANAVHHVLRGVEIFWRNIQSIMGCERGIRPCFSTFARGGGSFGDLRHITVEILYRRQIAFDQRLGCVL